MHIRSVHAQSFKRFTDLTIEGLPETARLIVLTGPNGTGKSSLFDAFRVYHGTQGVSAFYDQLYHQKTGLPTRLWPELVQIDFHEPVPTEDQARWKMFYTRSAYRHEADFAVSTIQRREKSFNSPRLNRLIDNDVSVAENYQLLVSATIAGLYSSDFDNLHVPQLRDVFIGRIRSSMQRVFPELLLEGPGDPMNGGAFFFEKGVSPNFHYKNLSAGEKAAFDLLLDLVTKATFYNNTVFCIDEPEAHMHTSLQARLLEELLALIPESSQLWIATHSIGMMRKAKEMYTHDPATVVFLDFGSVDFDQPVTLKPAEVNRNFWTTTLRLALDDLAELVAPKQVVLCEGRPGDSESSPTAEVDASCYRVIFSREYPDTQFVSVGNSTNVIADRFEFGPTLTMLVPGVKLLKLVDRDERTPNEITALAQDGTRVLSRRHLEAYLFDSEILHKLCSSVGKSEQIPDVLAARDRLLAASVNRGKQPDDVKAASKEIRAAITRVLQLTQAGSTTATFMRDVLAPLVDGTKVYDELRNDVFGPSTTT